jgi:hypothetical protein
MPTKGNWPGALTFPDTPVTPEKSGGQVFWEQAYLAAILSGNNMPREVANKAFTHRKYALANLLKKDKS